MSNPLMQIRDIDRYATSCSQKGMSIVRVVVWVEKATPVPDTCNRLDVACKASCNALCIKVPYNASSIVATCCKQCTASVESACHDIAIFERFFDRLRILLFPRIWFVKSIRYLICRRDRGLGILTKQF